MSEGATRKQPDDPNSNWARKRRAIAKEFVGNSQLAYLNAMLISNLRKRDQPDHTAALFVRLWAEQSDHLIQTLNLRWLISSVQTFADHGQTTIQRETGQALRMLFGVMKLYEFERTFSRLAPQEPFDHESRLRARLPLDMSPFSLDTGGLDINLIAPVWQMALQDPAIGPLTDHLFTELNKEDGGVFRRLKKMRENGERAQVRK